MKKLLFIFLLFGLMPILGMDREDAHQEKAFDGIGQFFAHGLRRFDPDTVIEALIKVHEASKKAEVAELLKEYLKIETSDGYEYTFTQRDLRHLQSGLLNKFWETDDVFDFTRPLAYCDAQTLETILKLAEAHDRDEILASLSESEMEKLIVALDELQMPLCDEICKWVAKNYDFTRFDGKNLFPEFIKDKEERCCCPLQQALVKKLYSTEFALKEMSKNPITWKAEPWDSISSVAISSDNSFITTGASWGADMWRLNEAHELTGERISLEEWWLVVTVAISSDNSFVVTGSCDRTAKIWKLNERYELIGDPITLEYSEIRSVAIASDNSFIVTRSWGGTAQIWRLNEEHEPVGDPIPLEGIRGESIAISSDNSFIVMGESGGTAKIWKLNGEHECVGDPIILGGHIGSVISVAISSDNSFIVTVSGDGTAKIWRLNEEHELVGDPINLRGYEINLVVISSDNSFIVAGSDDETAKIWRLNKEHEIVGEPITCQHTHWITSIAIARDNSFIVTVSSNGKVKVWRSLTVDALELNLSQILLLLKLATSPSKIDFTKETVEIRIVYESLPENLKRVFDRYNDTTLTKIWKTVKNPKIFLPTVGIGAAAWLAYKFMKN